MSRDVSKRKRPQDTKRIMMIALLGLVIDSHEREQQTKLEIVNWPLVAWERKNLTL